MYQKIIKDGYIVSIASGTSDGNITEVEYNNLLSFIRNKPTPESGFDYRLKADLTWELYELPPVPEDDEITAEEALGIIRGGGGV